MHPARAIGQAKGAHAFLTRLTRTPGVALGYLGSLGADLMIDSDLL